MGLKRCKEEGNIKQEGVTVARDFAEVPKATKSPSHGTIGKDRGQGHGVRGNRDARGKGVVPTSTSKVEKIK